MLMTELGLAALQSREGVRLKAYRDSMNVPTIGWGHTLGVQMGQTITLAQAQEFLRQDIDSHAAPILAAIKVPIADHERDALISIAFNIGVGAFKRSTFLKRLNAGDRAGCAEAIMSWKKPPEIISRREAERDQFLTPYSVRAPKARSNDAGTVKIGATRPAKPVTDRMAVNEPVTDLTPIQAPRVNAEPPAEPVLKWWQRIFNVKVAPKVATVQRPGLHPNGDPALWDVQAKLRERAYYPVTSNLDGLDGNATQSAVAQSRKDNGLGDGGIDAEFLAALDGFPHKPVSAARANMSIATAAKKAPELFNPPAWLVSAGLGSLGLGGASGSGLLDNVQTAVTKGNDIFGQVQSAFGLLASVIAFVVEHKTYFLIGIGVLLVWRGVSAILSAWIKIRQAFF